MRRLDVVGNGHLLLQLQQTYVHSQVSVSASVRSGYQYPCYLKFFVVKSNKFNLILVFANGQIMIVELSGHTDVLYLMASVSVDKTTSIKYIYEHRNIVLFTIKYLIR